MATREKERNGSGEPQDLIGMNVEFVAQTSKIPKVASCDAGVLILGETGTGKEVFARKIHAQSSRATKPFVPVNCGAIPVELAENELFGHRQGAFTGAGAFKAGLIQEAEGGTLFLDEIDSLPALAQVKLLRFLQEKTYRPLGTTKEIAANVRIMAAMNIDPEQALKSSRLRQDLYYRLNVISIHLPPLRQRREDVAPLAHHFLGKFSAQMQREAQSLSREALEKLFFYDWPGNVRELEHVIERTSVLCDRKVIQPEDIFLQTLHPSEYVESFNEAKKKFVDQFERTYLEKLLLFYHGNITKAARAAQKHRRAFFELIRKHRIDVERFKTPKTATKRDYLM